MPNSPTEAVCSGTDILRLRDYYQEGRTRGRHKLQVSSTLGDVLYSVSMVDFFFFLSKKSGSQVKSGYFSEMKLYIFHYAKTTVTPQWPSNRCIPGRTVTTQCKDICSEGNAEQGRRGQRSE